MRIGTQRAIAAQSIEPQADYALALKEKQGNGYEDVKDTLTLAPKDALRRVEHQFHEPIEKAHGRLEIGHHWLIDDGEHLSYQDPEGKWKGLLASGMVRAARRIGACSLNRDPLLLAQC
jgi:hypothetical protein